MAKNPKHFEEFAMHRVYAALCSPSLPAHRYRFSPEYFGAKLRPLVTGDCDAKLLCASLSFGLALPTLCPAPRVAVLDQIAANADNFLDLVLKYFPSMDLDVHENGETRYFAPLSGDFHLSEQTIAEMLRVRSAAVHFGKMIAEGQHLPFDRFIGQIAYLWPTFYVKQSTGRAHQEEMSVLLEAAGFPVKNAEQLSKAEANVMKKTPLVGELLLAVLESLPAENSPTRTLQATNTLHKMLSTDLAKLLDRL